MTEYNISPIEIWKSTETIRSMADDFCARCNITNIDDAEYIENWFAERVEHTTYYNEMLNIFMMYIEKRVRNIYNMDKVTSDVREKFQHRIDNYY